jgi:hypothetical protein
MKAHIFEQRERYFGAWLSFGLIGLASYIFLFFELPFLKTFPKAYQLIFLGGISAFLSAVGSKLLFNVALSRIKQIFPTTKVLVACLLVAFLSGMWLAMAIPLRPTRALGSQSLEIIATGNKNSKSKGSEVRLLGLFGADQRLVSYKEFLRKGEWRIKDGQPTFNRELPAILQWQSPDTATYHLVFQSSPQAGVVKVIWNGKGQTVDLYAPASEAGQFSLILAPKIQFILENILFILAAGILIGLVILVIFSLLVETRRTEQMPPHPKFRQILLLALPMILIWGSMLLIFWPGFLSPDSAGQWGQVVSGVLHGDHRFFHTLTVYAVTQLFGKSVAVFSMFQIFVLASVISLGGWKLFRLGLPAGFVTLYAMLNTISPVNMTYSISLWSDVLFGAAVLYLTIQLIELAASRGAWLEKRYNSIWLGASISIIALLRSNGLLIGIAVLPLLWLTHRAVRRQVIYAGLSFIVILFTAFYIIKPTFTGTSSLGTDVLIFPIGHRLAAHTASGTLILPQERAILKELRPEDQWPYNCYYANNWAWDGKINYKNVGTYYRDLLSMLIAMDLRNPGVEFHHTICVSSLVWRITQPPGISTFPVFLDAKNQSYSTHDPQDGKYKSFESKYPCALVTFSNWINASIQPSSFLWIFWSSAFWLYTAIFAAAVYSFRSRCPNFWIVLIPIITNSLTIAALTASQEYRYQYAVILSGMLITFSAFLSRNKE